MLARIDKKELAERAKRMKATTQAPQDLKLKAPATMVPTPTADDEETDSGLVFKRKRKAIIALPSIPTQMGMLLPIVLPQRVQPSHATGWWYKRARARAVEERA